MNGQSDEITLIIRAIQSDNAKPDELIDRVYEQLRAIANNRMRGERVGHTLQATELVNEACMRLLGNDGREYADRRAFFGAAAEAMRRILIDHARKRDSAKRGGGRRRIPLSILDLAEETDLDTVMALDEALQTLAEEDQSAAEVVRLRFFSGLSVAETAEVMGLSERTVAREWNFARATLFKSLGTPDEESPND